ncbi:MAG: Dps family protein [Bdellovibrio sp.]
MRTQSSPSSRESHSLSAVKIEQADSATVVETLKKTLADAYILQLKTQNFHWNVEGPLFFSLHKLFEEQYNEIAGFVDRCAEVLRALKCKAPGSFREFQELASIQEVPDKCNCNQMIEILSQDHTNMAIALKSRLEAAEDAEETSAVTLYEDMIGFHEKAAWMIRSHKS